MATTAHTLITAPRTTTAPGVRPSACRSERSTERSPDSSIGVYRRSMGSTSPCSTGRRVGSPRTVPAGGPGSTRRLSRPNYAARRLGAVVLLAVAALAVVLSVNGLLASLGAEPASAAGASPAFISSGEAPVSYVARSGDTLWSIAHEHRGEVDHDTYVRALIRLNGGATVQAGQTVRLP